MVLRDTSTANEPARRAAARPHNSRATWDIRWTSRTVWRWWQSGGLFPEGLPRAVPNRADQRRQSGEHRSHKGVDIHRKIAIMTGCSTPQPTAGQSRSFCSPRRSDLQSL
ncbi:hypothetical protein GCM10010185_54550 [Saccharothrix coeruleofusca]|uniref:Uncharacterized protein n=1 Tax=Saccharothrix coeruleofusca TaxID=33919 RepID=A0A918EGT8_9PSEU|nr:hypothetical protein GCM10010185_54550 [Saccharothrix coeruleofusca]